MQQKQRGALRAAVAMTEAELPNQVDEEVGALFLKIAEKLYQCWSKSPANMSSIASMLADADRRGSGFLSDRRIFSILGDIGLSFTIAERDMFLKLLLPKSSRGMYSIAKVSELVMHGRSIGAGAGVHPEIVET